MRSTTHCSRAARRWLGLLLWLTPFASLAAALPVHHELQVLLEPDQGRLTATDRIVLPPQLAGAELSFLLHAGLRPEMLAGSGTVRVLEKTEAFGVPLVRYRLSLAENQTAFALRYQGRIAHPLTGTTRGGRQDTPGLIDAQGVYLDANSHWYPQFDDAMLTFRLEVQAPEGWHAVSQGERQTTATGVRWSELQPQDQIHLVAGPLVEYAKDTAWGQALVFLRQPDAELAKRYLEATAQYLDLYSRMLGPYPYKKFAVVENFWETGYGMPSFSLLGPRVIRFPFILHSSLPHEILHNWWGNGVYVDYAKGNWAEGLTSYLADHLLAEQAGQGAEYRRAALQKYADYVAEEQDFPLRAFRARHGERSQAIGYSKGLMLFHMLRRQLGDETFLAGLRTFYRNHRFSRAGFAELQQAFQRVSGRSLEVFFDQWLERTGAPQLGVRAQHEPRDGNHAIVGEIVQTQAGAPYALDVPVAVRVDSGGWVPGSVRLHDRQAALNLTADEQPLQLVVDPAFDVFRRLDRLEVPPSLGQLFGAETALFVLPADAPEEQQAAYRALARAWAGEHAQVTTDTKLKALPADRPVWIFGWNNRFRSVIEQALAGRTARLSSEGVTVEGRDWDRSGHSVALVARHPQQVRQTIAWLAADPLDALPGLARKLPHYGKYSYLVFAGDAPDNVAKGQWPVRESPLVVEFAPATSAAPPNRRPPLFQ